MLGLQYGPYKSITTNYLLPAATSSYKLGAPCPNPRLVAAEGRLCKQMAITVGDNWQLLTTLQFVYPVQETEDPLQQGIPL